MIRAVRSQARLASSALRSARAMAAAVATVLVSAAVAPANEAVSPQHDWPQWRGPTRDAVVEPARPWPETLELESLWSVDELGPSYSGPVVRGDLVYTTETQDATYETVRAVSRRTGDERWRVTWKGALKVPFFARSNGSWIRSTPTVDENTVYVGGIRDVLVALDAETGDERWRVDFVEENKSPLPAFGFVCSPLVTDRYVYVQAGGAFVKLDKRTGEKIWTTLADGGGMYGSAFSSPVLATIAGERQVLVQTRTKLAGIDTGSGRELWSREIPAFRGMNILTPTVVGDRLFTSTYGGGSVALEVSRDPPSAAGTKQTGDFRVSEVWKNPVQGYMSSPVVIGGRVYLHLRNQRMTCFDLASGDRKWTSTERFGKYMSLVAAGDRILALDQEGKLFLIRARDDRLEILDSESVSDSSTWAHLAVAGDSLFIRSENELLAFRWTPSSAGERSSRSATPAADDPGGEEAAD